MKLPPPLAEPQGEGYVDPDVQPESEKKDGEKGSEKKTETVETPENAENPNLAEAIEKLGIGVDVTGKYTTRPVFRSQLDNLDVKVANIHVDVLDLSKEADLAKYRDIKTKFADERSGCTIVREEVKFCEATQNWKVFVEWATILFKLPQNTQLPPSS